MTFKKGLISLMVAGTLCFHSINAQKPKPTIKANIIQTEVVSEKKKPISRTEILLKIPQLKSDLVFLNEYQNGKDYNKARIQILPFEYKNISLGIAGKHYSLTGKDPKNALGLVGRIIAKPTKKSFFKSDIRYFPKEKILSTKTFLDTNKVFYDFIGSYNLENRTVKLIPGIDYKVTKNIFLGIEAKLKGQLKHLKKDYLGLKFGIKY